MEISLVITTITSTVQAQNFPTLTQMTAVIGMMIFVFLPAGALVGFFGHDEEAQGDVIVTLWLLGCLLGSLLGALSSTYGVISAGVVPWGLTVFLAIALIIWLIKGGGH